MEVRILVLDDRLSSVADPLFRALKPFLLDKEAIPPLAGGEPRRISLRGLVEETVELIIVCNAGTTVEGVKAEIEAGSLGKDFDLILVDDQWGMRPAEMFAGQETLLHSVFRNSHGRGAEGPVICLWTQHWEDPTRTDKYTQLLRSQPYWGCNRVRGLPKSDAAGLRILIQSIVAQRRLQRENVLLRQVSHSDYKLLNHTRDFHGIDEVLLAVAQAIEPFFQWIEQKTDSLPDLLKPKFQTSFLFEGEPGSGKSRLCETIAGALDRDENKLPKDLGPTKYVKDWKKELNGLIRSFYAKTTKRCVVVVRADDLMLSSVATQGSSVEAEWVRFMYAIRDVMEDAAAINNGKKPNSSFLRGLGQLQGKILWLFARNREEEVGKMFAPLENFMQLVLLKFPKDPDVRKEILMHYAKKNGCSFAEDALELAVKQTMHYSGRDLVGGEELVKGFVPVAAESVRERERRRYREHKNPDQLNMMISLDVVKSWVDGPLHKSIVERSEQSHKETELAFAANNVLANQEFLQGRYSDVISQLDKYEAAYIKAAEANKGTREKMRLEDIASQCDPPVSHVAISDYLRRHAEDIRKVAQAFPSKWPHLRTLRQWP